ncbi:MAG TPA: hypothetical protein VLG76_02555 [Rhabdochlamydiaceae bacterium]|nr:hypothetical protein [Rhabdochlamydiaceae bacterium]
MIKKIFGNHLLTAFLPWIFFSIFNNSHLLWASLGALMLVVLFNFRELKQGFIMPVGSVIFFGFFALNDLFGFSKWAEDHSFLLINSGLAIIVCFSMIIGKPFTIQYAREKVDKSRWNHPTFLKVNWILTTIWAILMIIMALPSYFLTQDQVNASWFWNYGITMICIVIGLECNKIIPAIFKK